MANDRAGLEEPLVAAADAQPPKPKVALRQWFRLLGVWVITTLAAGIIPGAAVFVNMLAEAGTYGHLCVAAGEGPPPCFSQTARLSAILNSGQMIMIFAILPAGAMFDSRGGRVMGILGSVMVSAGMLVVSVTAFSALNGTDASTSWLVIVGMLVADCGSLLTAYAFFALVWHYPGSMTLIMALQSAVYQISAVLPIVLQAFMDHTGLNLGVTFVAFSGVVALTAPLYAVLVPTQQEYYERAKAVCGVPLPKPKVGQFFTKLRQAWRSVRLDLRDHVFLTVGFATSIVLCFTYSNMSSQLGKSLFGTQEAGDRLARMQVEATSLIGALCAPVAANIVDRVGLSLFLKFLTAFICVPVALFYVPQWWAATVTTYCFAGFNVCYNLFFNRYFMYYALPSRIGMYGGVFMMVMMVFMLPTNIAVFTTISMMPPEQRFLIPFRAVGVVSLLSLVVFNIRFRFAYHGRGVPEFPRMLPHEEEELCAPFGTRTVDETCKLLRLEKPALLRVLADPDPSKFKALIMSMNWSQVAADQKAWAQHADGKAALTLPNKAVVAGKASVAGGVMATATPSTARGDLTATASPATVLDWSPAAGSACTAEEEQEAELRTKKYVRDLRKAFRGGGPVGPAVQPGGTQGIFACMLGGCLVACVNQDAEVEVLGVDAVAAEVA